jgi:sec-independent protein translocase protein TatB
MGGFGFDEILMIMLISVLAFGKDLPRVARKAGLLVRRARRYLLDIKEDIERQIPMEELDLREDIENAIDPLPGSDSGSQEPLPYIPEEDPLEEKPESQNPNPRETSKPAGNDSGNQDPEVPPTPEER